MANYNRDLDPYIDLCTRLDTGASLTEQRNAYSASSAALGLRCADGVSWSDQAISSGEHAIPMRRYEVDGGTGGALILYFHGGGWVMGDLSSHHEVLSHLALGTGATVVAVDYPLAPEWRHPVQLHCCRAVLEHMQATPAGEGGERGPVVVAGDSAGGQLAAALCMLCRDRGGPPIDAQILVYPALDHTCASDSYRRCADGPRLTAESMKAYWREFLPPDPGLMPLASPLLEKDFAYLPPALIQLAEVDVLRDEGLAYAERLAGVGVHVETLPGFGMIHGFLRAIGVSAEARAEFDRLCARAKALISRLQKPHARQPGPAP